MNLHKNIKDYLVQLEFIFFTKRIVNNWNSLPDHIVNAGSVNVFKNSLDRLCL